MKKMINDWVISIVIAIVTATLINKFLFFQVSVPSELMYPTIKVGDNRESSTDDRTWSEPYIDAKEIKGKAQFIVYPFNRFGKFVVREEAVEN